jgi:hypothetical protein
MKIETIDSAIFRFRDVTYLRMVYISVVRYYRSTDEGFTLVDNVETEEYLEHQYKRSKQDEISA